MNKKDFITSKVYNNLIYFLLFWIVFQDFIISMLYNLTNCSIICKALLYSKDVIMLMLFLIACYNLIINKTLINRYRKLLICIGIYLGIIAIYGLVTLFTSNLGIISILASMRGIILLPVFIVIAMGIKDRKSFLNFIKTKFFLMLIIVTIIGIIDYYFVPKEFWKDIIGIGKYTADIKEQGNRLVEGLPGNFYGDYGKGFFSQKRLVSVWAVPLTAAYLLNIPFLYYLFSIKSLKKQYIKEIIFTIILFIAIIFTHTRAIIIPEIMILIGYILYKNRKYGYKLFVPIIILLIIGGIISKDIILTKIFDGSTTGHIHSIITSISEINILGDGIGTFGVWSPISTENSYITIAGQLGILGLVIYLLIWILSSKDLILSVIRGFKRLSNIELTVLVSTIIYFITGFASEQIFAFTTIVPYYILLGVIYCNKKWED